MKHSTLPILTVGLLALSALPSCVINVPDANSQHEVYSHPARVTQLSNGNYIVKIDNRMLIYNSSGSMTSSGGASGSQIYHANQALRAYRDGHRGDYMHPNYNQAPKKPMQVRPRGDGMIEVMAPSGGVLLYDNKGRLKQKGSTVTNSEFSEATRAVQSYLREQNSSRGYDGV